VKKNLIFIIIFLFEFNLFALNQECDSINYFSTHLSPTCWDDYKSDVYVGAPATFTNCGNKVPVNMSEGIGLLVIQSTKPAGD